MSGGKGDAGTGGSIEALLKQIEDIIDDTWARSPTGMAYPKYRSPFRDLTDELRWALLTRRDQPEHDGLSCAEVERDLDIAISERDELRKQLDAIQQAATRRDAPQETAMLNEEAFDAKTFAVRVWFRPSDQTIHLGPLTLTEAEAKRIVLDLIEFLPPVVMGRDADPAKEPGVIENLKNALEKFIEASQLPETCVHDADPDYCDGCHYAMEKAMQMARIHARAALATIPAAPPVAAKEPTE